MSASPSSTVRSLLTAGAAATGLIALSVLVAAPAAQAATTTLYVAPGGTGSSCSR